MNNENNNNENVNFRLYDDDNLNTYRGEQYSYGSGGNNNNRNQKKRSNLSYFTVSIIGAIIGGLVVSLLSPFINKNNLNTNNNGVIPEQINITTRDEPNAVQAVAKKSMKSVVGITTTETIEDFFFQQREVQGVGSGVIVDSNGYILTNSHVINYGTADSITVLFEDGKKKPAQILWHEKALDLAIIKVEGSNYPAADLGDSDKLNIGEIAVAIGNPLGLDFERTVTAGYISGLNRSIQVDPYNKIENLIQTDASINKGNSGGPLLNSKGEVIGINTLKLSVEGAEGLGFALPINMTKPIIEQVISKGKYTSSYIGIGGRSVKSVGIDLGVESGIIVESVQPNSPAEKAGIRQMNIIVSLNNKKIDSLEMLRKELYKHKPGDKVKIGLIKEGKKTEVELTLGEQK